MTSSSAWAAALALAALIAPANLARAQPAAGAVAPPAEIADIKLPEGRLTPFAHSAGSAIFLDLDGTAKTGSKRKVRLYEVRDPPTLVSGRPVAQLVDRFQIDCAARTWGPLRVVLFTGDGDRVGWSVPSGDPAPIAPGSAQEILAKIVCDKAKPPSAVVVKGHQAALSMARDLLKAPTAAPATP